MHILVRQQLESDLLWLRASLETRSVRLVDDDAIGSNSGDKGKAIAELRPLGVVVEGDVGQPVAEDGEEERCMADEPALAVSVSCINIVPD